MAINNNVQNVKFLRNGSLFETREAAHSGLTSFTLNSVAQDGTIVLARYGSGTDVKTLIGVIYYTDGNNKSITIFDVESSGADVEAKIQEIKEILGNGVSSANTVSDQLSALSGTPGASSADTSVEGAKSYAKDYTDEQISGLEYTGVTTGNAVVVTNVTEADGIVSASTANVGTLTLDGYSKGSDSGAVASTDTINQALSKLENHIEVVSANTSSVLEGLDGTITAATGYYINKVDEVDGKISGTTAALPTVAAISETGKPITAVSESLGEISATAGTIQAQYVDVTDADNNFTATNVEGVLAEIKSGYTSADAALKNEILGGASASADTLGELETLINNISAEAKEYHIVKTTSDLPAEIKERYSLVDAAGNVSGDTIDVPKDSHIVSITYITGSTDPHYQNLEYVYIDASGTTKTEYVDISGLVLEAEFASGVTVTNHVAHGVVDPTSEKDSQSTPVSFLTVGADGFKISGIKEEIDRKIAALDASVSGNSAHINVVVDEVDGVITGVTVTESGLATSEAIEELSGKTVTELESSNNSIAVSTAATTDGTVKYDVITDASKIQMSGYTAVTSGVVEDSQTVLEAIAALEGAFIDNEEVVAAALNDLETSKLENIVVNGVTGTVASNVATVTIDGADVKLDGYTAGSTGNVASTDSVNVAISKLENAISGASSGSSAALDNEIAHRKAVDGINGDAYSATTTANYISAATDLNDADQKLDAAIKEVSDVANAAVSGATMNGTGLTPSNGVLPFTAVASTSAGTATSTEAIVIKTDANGGLTFSLDTLDCGTY